MTSVNVGVFRQRASSSRVPNAPTGLALSPNKTPNPDTTSFRLIYDAATVPTGGTAVTAYRIYMDGLQVSSVAGTVFEPGLGRPALNIDPGGNYLIEVSAVNSYGEGPKSSVLSVTTAGVTDAPDAPVATAGTVTNTTAVVNWSLVTYVKGAPTYKVYKTTDLTTPVATGSATATSATVTGLTLGTLYSFVVKAVDPTDSTNVSTASNTVTMKTSGGGGEGSVPDMADTVVDSFGVNWHMSFTTTYGGGQSLAYQKFAIDMALLDLGCRHIRDAMPSGNNGQMRDAWLYFMAGNGGGNKVLLHCGADRTAGGTSTSANNHMNTHYDAIQWMGATFVSGISAFEGVNEPNNDKVGGSVVDHTVWGPQVRNMATALRTQANLRNTGATRLDTIPRVGVSMANRSPFNSSNYVTDYTELGDQTANATLGNIHVYDGGIKPGNRIQQVLVPAKKYSFTGLPFWSTEGGYYDAQADLINTQYVPDDVQAKYAPTLLMEHIAAGSSRFFTYEGLDDVYLPRGATSTQTAKEVDNDRLQGSFGLITTPSMTQSTWKKKKKWYALKRFFMLMADPGSAFTPTNLVYSVTPPVGATDVRWKLYQKRNGVYYLVLWRPVTLWQAGSSKSVPSVNVAVTLGTGLAVAMHTPSTQAVGHANDLASTAYKTLTSAESTSFTVSLGGDLQVLVLG